MFLQYIVFWRASKAFETIVDMRNWTCVLNSILPPVSRLTDQVLRGRGMIHTVRYYFRLHFGGLIQMDTLNSMCIPWALLFLALIFCRMCCVMILSFLQNLVIICIFDIIKYDGNRIFFLYKFMHFCWLRGQLMLNVWQEGLLFTLFRLMFSTL